MQSYSKSEWQRVGMYAKCQLLSKPFFFQLKRKMLLIRRLSNLQSKGFAVVCNEWDSLLLHKDMTKIHPKLVYFCHHEPSFNPINTYQFKDFFLIFISIIQTLAILTLKWIWAKTAAVRSFLELKHCHASLQITASLVKNTFLISALAESLKPNIALKSEVTKLRRLNWGLVSAGAHHCCASITNVSGMCTPESRLLKNTLVIHTPSQIERRQCVFFSNIQKEWPSLIQFQTTALRKVMRFKP